MDAWNSRRSFARRLRALAGVALLVASSSPVRAGEVTSPLPWVGLLPSLLVAGAAVLFAVLAATIIRGAFVDPDGEGFAFRRSAGGFGGPGLGWRLSGPFVRVLVGLALGAFAVTLTLTPGLLASPRANGEPVASAAASGVHSPSAASVAERQGAGASAVAAASAATK